jgi:hypothetical protein
MRRVLLLATPLLCLAGSAFAADLGPYYPPARESYAPPPPPVVERKIVEHHHYYHQAPSVYSERRVYVEPHVYAAPRIYAERVYPRYAYAYSDWRPRYFFPRRHFGAWGPHHRHHWR